MCWSTSSAVGRSGSPSSRLALRRPALRLAHVIAGAAWAGGAFAMILLVSRTAKLRGADGDVFMTTLLTKGRAARYFEIAAVTTVVAGGLLYWRASNGLQLAWITSPSGIAFTIGGFAAIVSLVAGGLIVGPAGKRADAIRARRNAFGIADLVLLGVAVVMMATARYW